MIEISHHYLPEIILFNNCNYNFRFLRHTTNDKHKFRQTEIHLSTCVDQKLLELKARKKNSIQLFSVRVVIERETHVLPNKWPHFIYNDMNINQNIEKVIQFGPASDCQH